MSIGHGQANRLIAVEDQGAYRESGKLDFVAYGFSGPLTVRDNGEELTVSFTVDFTEYLRNEGPIRVRPSYQEKSISAENHRALSSLELNNPSAYSRIVHLQDIGTQHEGGHLKCLAERMYSSQSNVPDGNIDAAYTYFAQLMGHDISQLSSTADPTNPDNFRTQALDLDSILTPFGTTCAAPDYLCSAGACVGKTTGGVFRDLARDVQGEPLMEDARNDANLALAQITAIIQLFQNKVALLLGNVLPAEIKRQTLRHVQAVVLWDWLPKLIDPETYEDVVTNGRALVNPANLGIFHVPLEFSVGCFRFGHSAVRTSYPWNVSVSEGRARTTDLIRYTHNFLINANANRMYDRWIPELQNLIDLPNPPPNAVKSAAIDHKLARTLHRLPQAVMDDHELNIAKQRNLISGLFIDLSELTLKRGASTNLPSAQELALKIAAELGGGARGASTMNAADLANTGDTELDSFLLQPTAQAGTLAENTPLWFYTLREAHKETAGRGLGPIASRVIMETLHAAIEASGSNMLGSDREPFTPLPGLILENSGSFTLSDLVRSALSGANV